MSFQVVSVAVRPYLFPPPRDAGEDQGRGLNDLNDWNVWNGNADDIGLTAGTPVFVKTKPLPPSILGWQLILIVVALT
jgi:hypothetical protein